MTTIDLGRDGRTRRTGCSAGCSPAAMSAATSRPGSPRRRAGRGRLPHGGQPPQPARGSVDGRRLGGRQAHVYESTQGIRATQQTVARCSACRSPHVRVIDALRRRRIRRKAMVWPNVTLTAMAARHVRRPVKLMLTRPQMFTSNGHREEQEQRITLGATRDGRLTAIRHEKLSITSPFDDWAEPATGVSSQLYACDELPRRAPTDQGQHDDADVHPRPGRGARSRSPSRRRWTSSRTSAVDPVELRLRNHTPVDRSATRGPATGCVECLRLGRRAVRLVRAEPGAAHDPRRRLADRHRDGRRGVPGRVLHAAAARPGPHPRRRQRDRADLDAGVRHRRAHHGDPGRRRRARRRAPRHASSRPATPTCPTARRRSGSAGAGMVSSAVHAAGTALREQLIALAVSDEESPLYGVGPASVTVATDA